MINILIRKEVSGFHGFFLPQVIVFSAAYRQTRCIYATDSYAMLSTVRRAEKGRQEIFLTYEGLNCVHAAANTVNECT